MANVRFVVVLGIALIGLGCASNQQAAWVSNSSLAMAPAEGEPSGGERLLSQHRVRDGDHSVLLLRRFYPGKPWITDDAQFEKLSIQLESMEEGQQIILPSDSVAVHYSRGSVGFVQKGAGAYSDAVLGTIYVAAVHPDSVEVVLDIEVSLRRADVFARTVGKIRISEKVHFERLKKEELTPWLGRRSEDLALEASPRSD